MPKYYPFKVAGYYLYYTMECVVECMHAHASDSGLTETGSAKLFIKPDGDTIIQHQGSVSDVDIRKIQRWIKLNHETMFKQWSKDSKHGYYGENK